MPAYKYTLKDGKTVLWYAKFYYTDWTGTKKQICKRGFKTQREAKEYERNYIDGHNSKSDILFPIFLEEYYKSMEQRLKPTTMDTKRYLVDKKIKPYFEKLKLCDINSFTVQQWQNTLLAYRDDKGKPYSKTYLKAINNQLSAILNYAVKHYGLTQNPCNIVGSIGKSKAGEMKFWTKEQYEHFASFLDTQRYRLAFDTLFYSGIREGELLALTPDDLIPGNKLNINKNYARLKGKDYMLTPKTDKSDRVISIPESLHSELKAYCEALRLSGEDRIFFFGKGALTHEMERKSKKAGIEKIRIHDLRHSHVSMLIKMGVNIKAIQERLGHESIKTTLDIYGHLYEGEHDEIANKLDDLRRA